MRNIDQEVKMAQQSVDSFMSILNSIARTAVDGLGNESMMRVMQEVGEHILGAINRELGRDVKTVELPAGVAAALLSYVLFAVNDNKSRIIIDASHISPTIN
jgi:hypothetical protein